MLLQIISGQLKSIDLDGTFVAFRIEITVSHLLARVYTFHHLISCSISLVSWVFSVFKEIFVIDATTLAWSMFSSRTSFVEARAVELFWWTGGWFRKTWSAQLVRGIFWRVLSQTSVTTFTLFAIIYCQQRWVAILPSNVHEIARWFTGRNQWRFIPFKISDAHLLSL